MTVVCTKCGALSIAQCTCSVITHNQYVYGGAIQMTDISNLKPGSALTYEQAMALPEGAVWSAVWCKETKPRVFTGPSREIMKDSTGEENYHLDNVHGWNDYLWHSARLESLPEPAKPELPVWVITCDRCGTTYKNNERHACVAREPAKPERQASEIEKDAALALVSDRAEVLRISIEESSGKNVGNAALYTWANFYVEAYDYAKSIGAIE